ncbi:deoxynucleoside triphosphate triphosphohydrolase SAMHD1-like isoform X2 [Mercenaria mercenaria]|uniref:deoxynucleoside triphosphate triphosphohydrolase SAMHD1-like isoform X2 n=1 Tax=Mercenaria mercenaria TaxID=6596 RepID=UPI00234EF6EC|nr:deoxynucleoside triphosphate triphosphohydrolase SAMHD1-like isoform X2 [Mercenaria mercenaria]
MASRDVQPRANDVDTSSAQARSANNIFKNRKVFNDPVHGQIEIHPVCIRIIDTPQFQRLRHIKQLDTCYLVYPGASHNRFEHSIGVCHLAGKLLKTIRERQPDETITERDILCVEIAGLCHDLGQGPFSHVFEKRFMRRMGKTFTHEGAARKMFEYMLDNNNGEVKRDIKEILRDCKIPGFDKFEEKDFTFIKEMIDDPKDIERGSWPYEGRGESKSFMYEIVANKRNGIDVDKWDYIARDSYMLGMKVNFDHNRCFASARVLEVNGMNGSNGTNGHNGPEGTQDTQTGSNEGNRSVYRKQICYREKEAQDLYDMFYTRMTLHRRAYQHKTHNLIGMMICDALEKVNETFLINGKKISDTVDDMAAYTQLTDNIIQLILYSPTNEGPADESGIVSAREILSNIFNRRLYKCVDQTQIKKGKLNAEDFKSEFDKIRRDGEYSVQAECIDCDIVNLDYGMEDKDPMDKIRFFKKEDIDTPIRLKRNQVSYVLPDTFSEQIVRIYYKDSHPDPNELQKVQKAFQKWCEKKGYPPPKGAKLCTSPEQTQQSTASSESGSRRNSEVDLENKRIAEPANVTTSNEETENQPESIPAEGIILRPREDAASDANVGNIK